MGCVNSKENTTEFLTSENQSPNKAIKHPKPSEVTPLAGGSDSSATPQDCAIPESPSIPTHVAIAPDPRGDSYVSGYAYPPQPTHLPSSCSSSSSAELDGFLTAEKEERLQELSPSSITRQDNLVVCYVAAWQLLNLQRVDELALDDLHKIIGLGMSEAERINEARLNPSFDAVTELSNLVDASPDLLELLSNGTQNGYFAFDHEGLVKCMYECVEEAYHNKKKKLAFFCVTPSNRVFLAVYHDENWWSWNTQPAMLERVIPDEVVNNWLATVPSQEAITVKAVVFHSQIATRALTTKPTCEDDDNNSNNNGARYNYGLENNYKLSSVSKDEEEKVEIQDPEPPHEPEPPSYGPIQPLPPTSPTRPRSSSSGSAGPSQFSPFYNCPISFSLMADPVTAADGYTYDRPSIEKHFRTSNKSPMTNLEISTSLFENHALRNLIEIYVDSNEGTMKEDDLLDFREGQRRRRENPRSPYVLAISVETTPEDEDDQPRPPSLCQLVRLPRPTEDEWMGCDDSGLSVALADESTRQASGHSSFCAVGCCTNAIGAVPQWCQRCQRPTCNDCLIVKVSNISEGKIFKLYKICLECTWQITDAIVALDDNEPLQDARERILREHVAPRLVAINQEMLNSLYSFLLRKVNNESPVRELLELQLQFERRLLEATGEAEGGSLMSKTSKETENLTSTVELLGRYEASLPLGLIFPTSNMDSQLASLRRWHDEAEPDLRKRAVKQRLQELQGASPHEGSITQCETISLTDIPVDLPDASSLAQTLIGQRAVHPSPRQHISTRTLHMCAYCASGPFETLPSGGCPNCNWQEMDFNEWPLWDGRFVGGNQ